MEPKTIVSPDGTVFKNCDDADISVVTALYAGPVRDLWELKVIRCEDDMVPPGYFVRSGNGPWERLGNGVSSRPAQFVVRTSDALRFCYFGPREHKGPSVLQAVDFFPTWDTSAPIRTLKPTKPVYPSTFGGGALVALLPAGGEDGLETWEREANFVKFVGARSAVMGSRHSVITVKIDAPDFRSDVCGPCERLVIQFDAEFMATIIDDDHKEDGVLHGLLDLINATAPKHVEFQSVHPNYMSLLAACTANKVTVSFTFGLSVSDFDGVYLPLYQTRTLTLRNVPRNLGPGLFTAIGNVLVKLDVYVPELAGFTTLPVCPKLQWLALSGSMLNPANAKALPQLRTLQLVLFEEPTAADPLGWLVDMPIKDLDIVCMGSKMPYFGVDKWDGSRLRFLSADSGKQCSINLGPHFFVDGCVSNASRVAQPTYISEHAWSLLGIGACKVVTSLKPWAVSVVSSFVETAAKIPLRGGCCAMDVISLRCLPQSSAVNRVARECGTDVPPTAPMALQYASVITGSAPEFMALPVGVAGEPVGCDCRVTHIKDVGVDDSADEDDATQY